MSLTPPGPPVEPPAPDTGAPTPTPAGGSDRSAVVLGLLVGVLVFAVAAAGFAGWRVIADRTDDEPSSQGTPTGGPSPSPSPSVTMPATDPALARFYDQKLSWHDCGRNRCATLEVPLDYAKPAGQTLGLQVLKVPAQTKDERIGALVVNPGGPGGSGVDYAAGGSLQFGNPLSDHFDIVGFDPRGVGTSDPLHCVGTKELDKLIAFDPDPDDADETSEMDRLIRGFGQGCLDNSGDLARHMSTKEAARDMDILRAALGEPKLDYLGASYGTFLGATYANEFPQNVGRFVLDGAIDPSLSNTQLGMEQAHGFETALRAYVQDCVEAGDCFLGRTVGEGTKRIQEFLDQVDQQPLETGSSRELTEGLAMMGIWLPLYVKSLWDDLSDALKAAIDDDSGSALLTLADYYSSRGPDKYDDNGMEALYAVNCLDHDDYVETKDVPSYVAEFEKASPTFGRAFAYSLSSCSNWPVKSGQRTVALHAKGAPPIVVVGTTRDPATPLIWAQALARQLDSGRLITRDGDGHTGFRKGNSCVDDAVEKWLIDGKVPRRNLMC